MTPVWCMYLVLGFIFFYLLEEWLKEVFFSFLVCPNFSLEWGVWLTVPVHFSSCLCVFCTCGYRLLIYSPRVVLCLYFVSASVLGLNPLWPLRKSARFGAWLGREHQPLKSWFLTKLSMKCITYTMASYLCNSRHVKALFVQYCGACSFLLLCNIHWFNLKGVH